MDLSSSSSSISTNTFTLSQTESQNQFDVETDNSREKVGNDDTTVVSNSLYDSAVDASLTAFVSFSESANNNSLLNSATKGSITPRTISSSDTLNSSGSSSINDFDIKINGSEIEEDGITKNTSTATITHAAATNESGKNTHFSFSTPRIIASKPVDTNQVNASILFIQSESTETNTSQEEVDPKSQLANKTIFKTDNPNLSIIEINENSLKEQDIENSVLVIETSSDDDDTESSKQKKGDDRNSLPSNVITCIKNVSPNKLPLEIASEKRRRKAESLIYSSKQKLNIAIAEASAAESASLASVVGDSTTVGNGLQPATKREIKIYDSLQEFENNLPSTVTVLDTPFGSRVYLVGTAHFSEDSQDDVSFVIRNVRPDVVMVELCPSRIPILKLDEKTLLEEAKNFNLAKIRSIIQSHGFINGIFFVLLLQMSAQIAKDLGMAPGGEFRRAFEEIHKLPGCMLHLGDRPIRVTLHRALRALSLWQTMKLVWRLTSTDTISIEEVEECKQRDLLEKLMQEMAGEFPAFSDVFVKERDIFLCHSLQLAALPQPPTDGAGRPKPVKVVGVVGIGHANGIAKMWGRVDPQTIPAIMEIPPASLSTRVCKYTLKYGLIGLTIYGVIKLLRPRLNRLY